MTQRWGFTVPLDGLTLHDHKAIVQEAERDGYTDAWGMEVNGVDCFTPLALIADWTEKMRVGTAITNVYTRSPSVLAMQAAGVAEAAPGRFVLGIGSSSPVIVDDWGGVPFVEPYQQTRDVARVLREALAGKSVTVETPRIRLKNFRLSRPLPAPVPLFIAALRSGMLRLAGRLGDGVVINWLSAEDVKRVVAVAHEGAVAAGRDPQALEVVCRLFLCVTDDIEAARTAAKRSITAYLTTPVYFAFHDWLGRGDVLRPVVDAWQAGNRRGALAAVPDSLVDELLIIGNAEHCRARVLEYCAAGVTTPVLTFAPLGDPTTHAEQEIAALRALAPARVPAM